MRNDLHERAAVLFPQSSDALRARWISARAQVGAPRVRVGCGCQCSERGVFAPRTLREAYALDCAIRANADAPASP